MRFSTPDTFRARRSGSSDFVVRAIALAVLVVGFLNLWSALLAQGPGRSAFLHDTVHLPLIVTHASRTVIALFGLALIMLARSLARHKRQAWWFALFLAALSPLPHLAKGLDYEEAIISLLMAGVLLLFRHAFYAENDLPSARQGAFAALGLFLFTAVYGPLGYFLLRDRFHPAFTWDRAIHETTHQIFYTPPVRALRPIGTHYRRAQWFEDSLQTISVISIAFGLTMLLRPVLPRGRQSAEERGRARRLLQAFAGDPIGYFALLPDKRYLFEEFASAPTISLLSAPAANLLSGSAASPLPAPSWGIAYVVVGRNAVVLGDPFGDPARAGDAIGAFLENCRRRDWSPAFYQVTARNLSLYRSERLRPLKIGEDALIDLPQWSLKGKSFQDLRTAINKMGRNGVAFEEFLPFESNADTLTQMDAISEEWLRTQKGEEKTFGLGRFDPGSDAFHDGRIFLARETETNRVLAFVSFVPIFGRGWGLDLMRRGADTPNGLMEFLIASAALRFQSEGAELFSLGLSPLAGGAVREPGESELVARGRELLYQRFNLFYGFKGLHAFKEKFSPRWEPRYLIYPGEATLAQTVYAIIRAHSPRGLRTFLWR